jgi:hypothetical protein
MITNIILIRKFIEVKLIKLNDLNQLLCSVLKVLLLTTDTVNSIINKIKLPIIHTMGSYINRKLIK